jgi:hypothetical protein
MTENMCCHPAVDFWTGYKLHWRNSVIQQRELRRSENVCIFSPPVFQLQFGCIWERFSTQLCTVYTTAYFGNICSHSVPCHINVSTVKYQANGHSLTFVDPCIIVQFIKKNPTRCNNVSKFYYSVFVCSTCFGRHTAHHQEPKTALAASGFLYVEGCCTCSQWTLSGTYCARQRPSTCKKKRLPVQF